MYRSVSSIRRRLIAVSSALAAALVLAVSPVPGSSPLTEKTALSGKITLSAYAAESVFPSDSSTKLISDQTAGSTFAILVNAKTGKVTAQKNGDAYMYPASMTKVMTLLVA